MYQNIANQYKKLKKFQAALQAAEKAVHINSKMPLRDRLPICYFVKACLLGILDDPSNAGLTYTECLNIAHSQQPSHEAGGPYSRAQAAPESFSVLKAAALHNMAIEWANLHMPDQTREALASAMEVGVQSLAQTHPVVVRILETYKILRQSFLHREPPVTPSKSSRPVRPNTPTTATPSAPSKLISPATLRISSAIQGNQRSPRVMNLQSRTANLSPQRPPSANSSPQRPPARSRLPEAPAVSESPRKRTMTRPITSPEVPTGLSGVMLSPGATRTSHLTIMPDEIYTRALGSAYNSHRNHVRAEARMFVVRRKAAVRIQVQCFSYCTFLHPRMLT